MAIDSVQVCDNIGSRWGVTVKDYTLNGVQTDPAAYFSGLTYWNC